MTMIQKIIKYCVMVFAILLVVGIVGGMASFVYSFTKNDENEVSADYKFEQVENIKVDVGAINVDLITGDHFEVQIPEGKDNVKVRLEDKKTLVVKQKSGWFHFDIASNRSNKRRIVIIVPKDFYARKVELDLGTGNMKIEQLHTKELQLDGGVGNVKGKNIESERTKIDGGVGNIEFENVKFNDLNFDCGVGNVGISGEITGKSEIHCGVGNVDVEVDDSIENYDLEIQSDVGKVCVNGEKVKDYEREGVSAKHSLEIDGDVGSVDLDFLR